MKADQSPADRRPTDPLFQGVDAALRRAAIKAQERRNQVEQALAKCKATTNSVSIGATPTVDRHD